MLISHNWLQSYFDEKLPAPEALAELLTFSFAEIESVEKKGEDTIFDIKVLPDRACYALSHRGVVYEVGAILGLKRKEFNWPQPKVSKTREIGVTIEATDLCSRYIARVVENVTAKELPWVKEHLEAVGQRSINPIVDGANIVIFDMGQPLHAFDMDKVEGDIVVRLAKDGEKITTLDNKEVVLDEKVLIIADNVGPLAIAGIKGGKKAEVTASTKNLILESANFDASNIRKTSEWLGIKTDASKRFENRLSPSLGSIGMEDFTAYLFEMDKNIRVGEIRDTPKGYSDVLENIRISPEYICEKLGLEIAEDKIEKVLSSLLIDSKKEKGDWIVTPPGFRVDLAIPEDIAEEVGRIIGYDKIPAILPLKSNNEMSIPKSFCYEWKIREALVKAGFLEIMTSSFSSVGDRAIEKPLAEDKKYARCNLRGNFEKALKMNALNASLLGEEKTCIFEIGRVFTKDGERTALTIGVSGPKKKVVGVLESAVKKLSETLGTVLNGETKDGVFECVLDDVFEKLPEPTKWDISVSPVQNEKFNPFSLYPFIVRDVALFVPIGTDEKEVHQIILAESGPLVVRSELFDRFEKPARIGEQGGDAKISYAFRLVFQSLERTLTDEEVNKIMEKAYSALSKRGWQIR